MPAADARWMLELSTPRVVEPAGPSGLRALEAAAEEYGAFVGRRAVLVPSGAARARRPARGTEPRRRRRVTNP